MAIFQIKDKKLFPIKEKRFDLEKDLQKIVEENLQTLFGLQFVSSEFSVEGYYIDTLAYDPETNSFVIIEYKKDKSFSVVDQGLHYLSLMLAHKADFVLEFYEKLNKKISKNGIDWSQSRVMFLAKNFTSYQIGSTSFRNFPIELWEISIYENGVVDFNQVQAAKTVESITQVAKGGEVKKIAESIKEFTIEDHLNKGSEEIKNLFLDLRDDIMHVLGDNIKENPTKFYYGFKSHGTNFAAVRVRKNKLLIDIRIEKPEKNRLDVKKLPQSEWDTTPLWRFEINGRDKLRQAMDLIEQSYNYYERKFS